MTTYKCDLCGIKMDGVQHFLHNLEICNPCRDLIKAKDRGLMQKYNDEINDYIEELRHQTSGTTQEGNK